jgi:hypothetical protein
VISDIFPIRHQLNGFYESVYCAVGTETLDIIEASLVSVIVKTL